MKLGHAGAGCHPRRGRPRGVKAPPCQATAVVVGRKVYEQAVGSGAAADGVVFVIVGNDRDRVVANARVDGVAARTSVDRVVAAQTRNHIVAVCSIEDVVTLCPCDHIE